VLRAMECVITVGMMFAYCLQCVARELLFVRLLVVESLDDKWKHARTDLAPPASPAQHLSHPVFMLDIS
jgi:hypothetical protein